MHAGSLNLDKKDLKQKRLSKAKEKDISIFQVFILKNAEPFDWSGWKNLSSTLNWHVLALKMKTTASNQSFSLPCNMNMIGIIKLI